MHGKYNRLTQNCRYLCSNPTCEILLAGSLCDGLRSPIAFLIYQVIGNRYSSYAVREGQLRAHLSLLKVDCYVVEGFEQLEARLQSGRGVPGLYVVSTGDDGDEVR